VAFAERNDAQENPILRKRERVEVRQTSSLLRALPNDHIGDHCIGSLSA